MTPTPLALSPAEVRAVLGGATELRRVVEPQPVPTNQLRDEDEDGEKQYFVEDGVLRTPASYGSFPVPCPFGRVGDRLWVQEVWCPRSGDKLLVYTEATPYYGATDQLPASCSWRSATSMPKWASRLTLEVTAVRVEPLQDMTIGDAIDCGAINFPNRPTYEAECKAALAAGVRKPPLGDNALERYARWWDETHVRRERGRKTHDKAHAEAAQAYSWASNPWVWVLGVKKVEL